MFNDGASSWPWRPRRVPPRYLYPIIAYAALIPACLVGYVRNGAVRHFAANVGGQINTDVIVVSFALFCFTAYSRRQLDRRMLWWAIDAALGMALLVDSCKLCGLPRPTGRPYGFPSGHTALMYTLAWIIGEMYPPLAPLWYIMADVIGWSRVETSSHFPYQVLAGAPMGFAVGYLVTTLPEGLFLPRFAYLFQRRKSIAPLEVSSDG